MIFSILKDAEEGEGASMKAWKETLQDFFKYFNELSADRRKNPTDDLASLIANVKVDGEYLPESFVNGYYVAIATAGHDTTSSTISGAIEQFARHPELLEAVHKDPSLIPGVIDEALRWASPVKHFFRIVAEDTEFRCRKLSAGEGVMLLYPSANRDEEVFENPNEFDITRKPNKHLAFGFGAHQCIGQHVASSRCASCLKSSCPALRRSNFSGNRSSWPRTSFPAPRPCRFASHLPSPQRPRYRKPQYQEALGNSRTPRKETRAWPTTDQS